MLRAYIALDRRVRPENLQTMIQQLLKEPTPDEYLTLSIQWDSVCLCCRNAFAFFFIQTAHGQDINHSPSIQVHFVDSPSLYHKAVEYLKTQDLLGFDSEWKPNTTKVQNKMALLQVASEERVGAHIVPSTCPNFERHLILAKRRSWSDSVPRVSFPSS